VIWGGVIFVLLNALTRLLGT